MKELILWGILIVAFWAFIIYLINIGRYLVRFVSDSYWGKKFDVEAFNELLLVIFLGQYGIYVGEKIRIKNGYYDTFDLTNKKRNIYIAISLLTVAWFVIPIVPNTRYGTEVMESLIEKKYYQTYYKASIVALDDDYSQISPEILAMAELEHDDGYYWVKNVYVENMGTYHAYSSDPFADFGEKITITDIDNKNYNVRIFNEKPEFRVIENFYTKVAGVTFENNDTSRQDILKKVKSGIKHIWLIRDKENQYDKSAVIVHSYYGRIGYINADLAPYIASILDNGGIVKATVSEVTGGNDGQYYGCNLYIEVLKQVR